MSRVGVLDNHTHTHRAGGLADLIGAEHPFPPIPAVSDTPAELTAEQREKKTLAMFGRYDLDKDGHLSQAELKLLLGELFKGEIDEAWFVDIWQQVKQQMAAAAAGDGGGGDEAVALKTGASEGGAAAAGPAAKIDFACFMALFDSDPNIET